MMDISDSDSLNIGNNTDTHVKRTVLDVDDVISMVPKLKGHEKLVGRLLHWLSVDKVNDVHSRYFDTPGAPFVHSLLKEFDITVKVDGREILDNLPEGSFITVSNHPFGALDGITLIDLIAQHRPDYKVMVNMVLGRITAMRPNFIAVDALASDDPKKKAVSMRGIKEAINHVKAGHPIGFFPAGAVSKVNIRGRLMDRKWQESVTRLITKLNVPVIPIYFHGSNSWWFNFLGVVCWQARTLRLPAEVWRKCHSTIHVSVGKPIPPELIKAHSVTPESLGNYLKAVTYSLRDNK